MWAPSTVLVKYICLFLLFLTLPPLRHDSAGADYFVICWFIVFPDLFLVKKPFIYDIFLKIIWFLKHHWHFMVWLVLMLLLTHVAVFTADGTQVYSDLHYVYRQVLLKWSSLKSSIARKENEQCCYKCFFGFLPPFPVCYLVLWKTDIPHHATGKSFLQLLCLFL